MKKKVFSKLLMVALVATVGAFTSCKDYDDDINDLRSQINGLETSLKATIDKNASDAANSLAILEKQLADVKVAYADADAALDTQLKALKNDVSTAMTSLQGGIDANKANIATNLEAINNLKSEVASLKTAVGTLEAAKESLEKSLKETNDLLKSQGETIATLVQADQNLEKGINEAKALATKAQEAADAAQRAADKVAADLATLTTQEANDVANLQKQISDNLASLTKKIDDMNAALDARIKTNTQSISDLATKVAENYATIVYVDKQIQAVKDANTKVANDLAAAQTDLEAKIKNCGDAAAKALQDANDAIMKAVKEGNDAQDKALEAAEKRLKEADDKQDAYLAQQLIEINTKIGDVTAQAGATATALDLLAQKELADYNELITKLETAFNTLTAKHDADLDLFKNQVITEIIPAQVATQVAYYVPKAMQDFFDKIIKPYVDNVDEKHTTLLNEFIERFEADSIKMDAYLAGEYLLAIQALVGDTADVLRDEMALTAQNLKDAYEFADNQLKQNLQGQIDDMNNPEKEGSLANLLKTAKENLQGQITTANGKIEAIETFLGKSEEGFSYETLAASIAETEVFGNAIENAVKEAYGEILSMVTSINLYANQHQAQDNEGGFDGFDHTLVFTYIVEKADVKFPAAEGITDAQIDFTDGMFRSFSDSILVRVSPTNAKLSAKDIALINSQGENIVANNVIEVTEVSPYVREEGQYITRGENTGLWVIKFKINERQIGDDFKNAAYTKDNKSILYAVAVKSGETAEDAADRYVISEYDLDLATADAYPGWDFDVNEISIADIHNRYIETDMEFVKTDIKEGVQKKTYKKELTWIGYGEAGKAAQPYADAKYYKVGDGTPEFKAYKAGIPAVSVITEGEKANATDRFGHTTQNEFDGIDNRHKKEMLDVNVDQEIKISFPDYYDGDINYPILVKGFYVTLDQEFALESYPSEYNQWTNYTYENVGYTKIVSPTENEVVKAKLFERKDGKTEGTIKIKNLGNVKGDVIGFRVYAVNVDGTLYDPDGRAFYVRVGNPYLVRNLSFNVFAETPANSGAIQEPVGDKNPIVAQNEVFAKDQTNTEDPFFNVDPDILKNYNFVLTWGAENPKVLVGTQRPTLVEVAEGETGYYGNTSADLISELFDFQVSDDVDAKYGEGDWSAFKPNAETQNVSVRLKAANRLINDTTYNLVLTIYKRYNNNADPNLNSGSSIIEKVNIKVKKSMPDYLPEAFGVRISQENEAKDMKFYLRPLTRTSVEYTFFGPRYNYDYSWDITKWFDPANTDKNWGLSNIDEKNNLYPYRWATDVRPYNFEEIFTGLQDENKVFDENYQFVFEGCGNFVEDEAEDDAVSTFRMYGSEMNYNGLTTLGEPRRVEPGYYLPFVNYNVINTYGTTALAVKASYVYEGVSLKVVDDEIVPGKDYVSKPIWFDANGKEVTDPAQAAFQAKFVCAIDKNFTLKFKAPTPTITANGLKDGNVVPYGENFIVKNTGSVSGEISWKSNLAAFTYSGAKLASYFKTNFNQFTSDYNEEETSYYTKDGLKVYPEEATNGWANVYSGQNVQNWLKLVDVNLGSKQLEITEVKIYKFKESAVEVTLNEANKNLDRIYDYFAVTKLPESNGLSFQFKGDALNPGGLGKFEIKLKSSEVSGKLLHQWGHNFTSNDAKCSSEITVVYKVPNSDPNLSRQTR